MTTPRRIVPLVLCALLAGSPPVARAEPPLLLDRPAYPIYAVCAKVPRTMSEADIRLLATQFTFAHGGFESEQIKALHAANAEFKVLHYMNSTYTRPGDDVAVIESRYRLAIAMLLAATLGEPIDAEVSALRVVGLPAGRNKPQAIAIRGSTVDGDTSDPDHPTQKFVFWVRIGDELMRVQAFDPQTGRLDVRRGFDGSTPSSHAAGARVFSPVYLGYKRKDKDKHPGNYAGGAGDSLRYVLDPGAAESWRFKAEQALALMSDGTDGVWLDTLNTGDFNLSDCLGRNPTAWNFAAGGAYRKDDFRAAQERKIDFMQRYIHQKTGRYPYMVANNMVERSYEPGRGGLKLLLMPTQIKPRPLDGYCMEGALSVGQPVGGWDATVRVIMDAAQSGAAAAPIMGPAGSKAVDMEADTPARDRRERFAWATYLLAVEKGGRTMMGTYAFYTEGDRRFVKVHRQYLYPLGDPAESVKPDELARYRVGETPIYQRRFTGGLVLVNPSDEATEVDVPPGLVDADTGEAVERVRLDAKTGRVLLKGP